MTTGNRGMRSGESDRRFRLRAGSVRIVAAVGMAIVMAKGPLGALRAADSGVHAVVLGIAQDAGIPHIGCRRPCCQSAWRDPARRQRVACLGLIDERAGARFLIDATPDISSQIETVNQARKDVKRDRPIDGVLLTHAHVGHYAGLMYLGREALGAREVTVYATPRMADFLKNNAPWSQLVQLGQIVLKEILPGNEIALTPDLRLTAFTVPHRDELSDTVGFRVRGPERSLAFIPDIDRWERWDRRLEEEVRGVDLALLDGTFFEAGELPGRSAEEIPHPLVSDTVDRLAAAGLKGRALFIHLNHTNRLMWDARARRALKKRGFRICRDGVKLPL